MIRIFTLLILGVGLQLVTKAQWSAELDTIEIKSSLIPVKSTQTGRNVTVVTADEVSSYPANSWDELLQHVPGLEVQSRNGFGAQADLLLRGSTFTQVLVLLDGMRMNDPLTSHFNANIPIPVAELARIEILRGPAAATYGPDAVGGVIHFITHSFEKPFRRMKKARGGIRYGSHQTINADQGLLLSDEKKVFNAGAQFSTSRGELIGQRTLSDQSTLEPYRNYFDIRTLGLAGAFKLNPNVSLHARSAYDYRDFSARYFYTSSSFDKSTEETQTWWNQVKMIRNGRRGTTDLNIAYKWNKDVFVFSPDFPSTNRHRSRFIHSQINHLIGINEDWLVKAGIQMDNRSIASTDRGDHSDWHLGVYAMTSYQPFSTLNLSASVRVDHDQNYGTEWLPQLNLSYQANQLVLRGAVGRSIRAADFTERYVSHNLANLTPGRSLGNPDLNAEQSWSQEAGLDYLLFRFLTLKLTFFRRNAKELIDYVPTLSNEIPNNQNLQPNETYFFAQNISDVTTRGLELETWYDNEWNDLVRLRFGLGYTFINTSNPEDIISVYLSNHAKHLLTSHYFLDLPRWSLGISTLFKSRPSRFAETIRSEIKPNYWVFHGKVNYRFNPGLSAEFQMNNIFDEKYSNILGAPMPRRWIMLALKWNLIQKEE